MIKIILSPIYLVFIAPINTRVSNHCGIKVLIIFSVYLLNTAHTNRYRKKYTNVVTSMMDNKHSPNSGTRSTEPLITLHSNQSQKKKLSQPQKTLTLKHYLFLSLKE